MENVFGMHKRKAENSNSEDQDHKNKHRKTANPSSNAPDKILPHSGVVNSALSNLLDALKVAIESSNVLDSVGIEKACDLHKHLNQNADKVQSAPAYAGENFPRMLSGIQLTPMTSKDIPKSCPTRPEVLNKTLELAAFTHQGIGSGHNLALNYEKLEWVGDIYIEQTATLFISQTFVSMSTGQCSKLRERFVKNVTLSEFSIMYGFDKQVRLPDFDRNVSNAANEKTRMKILGDVFEAYVAAVVLSDPDHGLTRATAWLKALLAMTLKDEIILEEQKSTISRLDSPLWNLKYSEKLDGTAPPRMDKNPKELLTIALAGPGVKVTYDDLPGPKKGKDGLATFKIGVHLTGWGATKQLLGVGQGEGKKQAGMKAAENALNNSKVMEGFVARKRLRDEQVKKEKELLEKEQAIGINASLT